VDIGSWLRGLGLERYEPAFRDNAIDAEVLPELNETDLEKLGVLLGHRKRLLRAIDELRITPLPAPAAAPSPATVSWSISATRVRMRTMPSGRSGRGWA